MFRTETDLFFPDKSAYLEWIQLLPGIFRYGENGTEELVEESEIPHFYSPQYLILRLHGHYYALRRMSPPCNQEEKAQVAVFWYAAEDTIYAAYLRDARNSPDIINGETIYEVRTALQAFLEPRRLITLRL